MMRKVLLALLCVMALHVARANQACPFPQAVTQPDGSTLTLRLVGDEFMSFSVTDDGYSVVKDAQGYYTYAKKVDGKLVATDVVAHDAGSRGSQELLYLDGVEKYLAPDMTEESRQMRNELKAATSATTQASVKINIDPSKFRGLVILVEYNDCSFTRDDINQVFTDMFSQRNYAGVPSATDASSVTAYTGSVRDYFYDASAGSFDPEFDVVGPVAIDYSMYDGRSKAIFRAACTAADGQVNFADYDGDGDGKVDAVYFVCAGKASNYTSNNSELVWPHSSTLSSFYLDGVQIYRYACSAELYGTSSSTLCGIGTICHEFSHVLGLRDLYDTDYDESGGESVGPGYWSIMASGDYLNHGRTPPTYSLYERYSLGFATPVTITSAGTYELDTLLSSNSGYRINSAVEDEYFLLENRQWSSWDWYLAGHGMLVWRVDSTDTSVWSSNDVNVDPDHNYLELIRATPKESLVGAIVDSDGDPFPGDGDVTILTNDTSPNIRSWTGDETPFVLDYIGETKGIISITVVADDREFVREDFESMPTFSTDTAGVEGVYASWDFTDARVMDCDDESGNGSHSASLYQGGTITSSEIGMERTDSLNVYVWNPSSATVSLHVYVSADSGSTWTEKYESGATTAPTIGASSTEAKLSYAINVVNPSLRVRICADGLSSSSYVTIDDVKLYGAGYQSLNVSETDPSTYLISTADDWNYLARYIAVNKAPFTSKCVRIENDIDFSSTSIKPLGYDYTTYFNGTIDGNGKTLSGISAVADSALFGAILTITGSDALICDLTVKGSVESEYDYTGGVVGRLYGTVRNVTSYVDVTCTSDYSGGIAGYAYTNAAIDSCSNYGSVTGAGFIGGVVGSAYSASSISNCNNYGGVTATGRSVGGIVGRAYGGTTVTGCVNYGPVSSTTTTTTAHLGGIAGSLEGGEVSDCTNYGEITASANYTGGILGICQSSASSVSQCVNFGTISGTACVGGVLGGSAGEVSDCGNYGAVTATKTRTGGIVGYPETGCKVSGCYNIGDVTNTLTSTYAYTGGIVGGAYADSTSVEVTECVNLGDVSAKCRGVGGIAGGTTVSISDVFNAGSVLGGEYVGGIVGLPSKGYTTLTRCISTGTIALISGRFTSTGNAGNIVGYNITATGTYWDLESNSVTDAYYLSANGVTCGDTSSVGLTYAEMALLDLGSAWNTGDNYTYPRVSSLATNEYYKVHAAAVVPVDGDTYNSITHAFYVGMPLETEWTSTASELNFSKYNRAWFSEPFTGTMTITVTSGEASKSTTLTCAVNEADGMSSVSADGRTVVAERFYTLSGTPVDEPSERGKTLYIVVRTYDDGLTEAAKEVR